MEGWAALSHPSPPSKFGALRRVRPSCEGERVSDRRPPELTVTNRLPSVGTPGARPMGNIPVLARLVLDDGTEMWRPARANRWTTTQVLVVWQNDSSNPWSTQMCWLATKDVAQAFRGGTAELEPLWRQIND